MKRLLCIAVCLPLAGCFAAGPADIFACGDGGYCTAKGKPATVGTVGTSSGGSSSSSSSGGPGSAGGAPCTAGSACNSGLCLDGYCCSTACAVDSGVCSASACASGSGECVYPIVQCGEQGCQDATLTNATTCVNGVCQTPTTISCAPYACLGAGCGVSCNADAQCIAGDYCQISTATCLPKLGAGVACAESGDCTSGQCLGGACCSAACSVSDPTCGATSCNDAGACVAPAASTACGTASCAGDMLKPGGSCDGKGNCASGAPIACPSGLSCNAAGTACKSGCATDADCIAGEFCEADAGKCFGKVGPGSSCPVQAAPPADGCLSDDCGRTYCCESVSCNTADPSCGATCSAGTGTCTYPIMGFPCGSLSCTGSTFTAGGSCDGNGNCVGGTPAPCSGNFACDDAGTGCNTTCIADTDCAAGYTCAGGSCVPPTGAGTACSGATSCPGDLVCLGSYCCATSCDTAGACGATACAQGTGACVYPTGPCSSASCAAGVETNAANCANGSCQSATTTKCAPYTCNHSSSCFTTCTVDGDCVSGYYCNAGACQAELGPGEECDAGGDCASGACLGDCCTASCTVGGACGATGCSDAGACLYPPSKCSAESCAGGVQTNAATCSGGSCPAATTQPCAPYTCNAGGTACYTSCTADGDCVSGYYCNAGSCQPIQSAGATCTGNDACASGQCLGNCCAVMCLTGGACGATSCASGTGACVYPTSQCSPESCNPETNSQSNAASCANGVCPAPSTTSCNPYACNGSSACYTTCTSSADCVSGDACSNGQCVPAAGGPGAACGGSNPACESGLNCLGGYCCATNCTTGGQCGASSCAAGTGACNYPNAQCGSESCANGSQTDAVYCSGGSCPTAQTQPCTPYVCNGSAACYTNCTGDADCVAGDFCSIPGGTNQGTCQTRQPPGQPCSVSDGCTTAACLGGYCCGAACSTAGACGATSCASGTGVCDYPTSQCRSESCSNGIQFNAANCFNGSCPQLTKESCAPYVCDGTAACYTSCTSDLQCFSPATCTVGGGASIGNGTTSSSSGSSSNSNGTTSSSSSGSSTASSSSGSNPSSSGSATGICTVGG